MITIDNRNNMYGKRDAKLCCPFRAMIGCVRVTWGGVHPHSRIHLPQADLLCPVGAKRKFSGLKGHDMIVLWPEKPTHVGGSARKAQKAGARWYSGLKGHRMSAQGNALG